MDTTKIKLEMRGDVAVITLDDPATLNAAGQDMARELLYSLRCIAVGAVAARAVVLTGAGRGFCSGANLSSSPDPDSLDPDGARDAGRLLETTYNPLMSALKTCPVPIVTAVNGAAAGIGCSIALMGDLIVAGESSYFLQAFRRIGLVPDGGSTYLLPRMIGRARAMEMTLLGEKIPAAKALEWGLINRCVPDADLMDTAMVLAQELAAGPSSLSQIRKLMWDSLEADWLGQLHAERMAQQSAGKSRDFIEGVTAFLQKRPAVFGGR